MAWDIADYPFTEAQWYKMVDGNISRPVALHEANLSEPWVYYRPWGLMYVPFGFHQNAMATLFAFHHGHRCSIDAGKALDIKGYRVTETLADRFLTEIEGTAFLSSAGKVITVGRPAHLDARERQVFRSCDVRYLED